MTPRIAETWFAQVRRFETWPEELDVAMGTVHAHALEHEATRDWLERVCGPHWRRMALGALRAFPALDGTWQWQGAGGGVWCVALPLLARNERGRFNCIDILALDPDGERGCHSLTGCFDGVLGPWGGTDLDGASPPLRLLARPLDWLRHVCEPAHDDDEHAAVCLAWPDSPAARQVLLGGAPELVVGSQSEGQALDRRIKALRRAALPPAARISVMEGS